MSYWEILQRSLEKSDPEKEASAAYVKTLGEKTIEPAQSELPIVGSNLGGNDYEKKYNDLLAEVESLKKLLGSKNATPGLEGNLIDKNSKPGESITKNSLSIALQRMRGMNTVNKPTYSEFEDMLGSYVNKDNNLSLKDRRDFRKKLKEQGINISRAQMRQIGKSFNRGETNGAFNSYVDGLLKNYYVKDGKMFAEDLEGWNKNDFEEATYKGTDVNALTKLYNDDVMKWRQNTEITYDPIKGIYTAAGFAGSNPVDITNSSWAKDRLETARNDWFEANKDSDKFTFNSEDGSYSFNGKKMKDSSWLNADFTKKLRADDYLKDVNTYGESAKFGDTYGVKGDWSKLNGILKLDAGIQKSPEYEERYRLALDDHLKDYTLKNGSVAGSALYNYLQEQGLLHVGKGTDVTLNPNHPLLKALLILSPINNETYNLKIGGSLNTRKARIAFKKGGAIQKAALGTRFLGEGLLGNGVDFVAGFIPGINTLNESTAKALELRDQGKSWEDIATDRDFWKTTAVNAGLDLLGPVAKGLKAGATAAKLWKGANGTVRTAKAAAKNFNKAENAYKTARAGMTPYLEKFATSKGFLRGTREFELAMTKEFERLNPKLTSKYNKTFTTAADALVAAGGAPGMTWKEAWKAGKAQHPINLKTWETWTGSGITGKTGLFMGKQFGKAIISPLATIETPETSIVSMPSQYSVAPQLDAYIPVKTSNYRATGNDWYYKQGGNINMEKINYFLEGGAMAPKAAPAAAPAKGEQDIQAQVMQLVQAAMSGDELANLAILQIMQAAQQGDQQAAQIAQMIQEVAKLMQGQATAAKNGAKLAYIKSLKSGCPAGTEAKYYKKGGTLCKECVSKSRNTEMYQDKGLFKATNSTSNAVKSAYNNIVNRVNNTIFGELQTQVETSGIDITGLYKKGGCLKKKLCGKKKAQEGAKVTEEKCGGTVKEKCGGKVAEEKCGGKTKKAKCELGAELNKCGGKTKKKSKCEMGAELEKCGGKAKKKYFGGSVESDKCGGKTKKAACGSKAPKAACGTKANMDKCGGKAKKKCLTGGILTLEALQAAYKSLNA